MAGNPRHEEALRRAYPEAITVECQGGQGFGQRATLTSADGFASQGECPQCAEDNLRARVAAFVPPRFRSKIITPAAVTEWAARGKEAQGLYLTGQVGTGKTHTAWCAVIRWCLATGISPQPPRSIEGWGTPPGPRVIFTRMTDLLDDLRPGEESRQRVRDCQNAELLGLDDVGAEKASEWTQERLYSVIDHRYANCLPLIVTSNLPPAELAGQTGDRAASRLAEMCQVVPITGTDRRKPGA